MHFKGFVLLQDGAYFARMSRVKFVWVMACARTKFIAHTNLTSNANEECRRHFESAYSET